MQNQDSGGLVRHPAVAGTFYPGKKEELEEMVGDFLRRSRTVGFPGKIRALIVPHAGYIYSGIVAAAGYKLLKDTKFKKFIILGPSHYVSFKGVAFSTDDHWSTPLGDIPVMKLQETDILKHVEGAHFQEHAIETQLPFLQMAVKDFRIMPLVLGNVSPEKLANELIGFMHDDTFIIVSSDLSHYHTYTEAMKKDLVANERIQSVDLEGTKSVEACGINGIMTLLHIAKHFGWKGILLDYKNSGDTAGDKNRVVGYGCYGFYEENKPKGKEVSS